MDGRKGCACAEGEGTYGLADERVSTRASASPAALRVDAERRACAASSSRSPRAAGSGGPYATRRESRASCASSARSSVRFMRAIVGLQYFRRVTIGTGATASAGSGLWNHYGVMHGVANCDVSVKRSCKLHHGLGLTTERRSKKACSIVERSVCRHGIPATGATGARDIHNVIHHSCAYLF